MGALALHAMLAAFEGMRREVAFSVPLCFVRERSESLWNGGAVVVGS